MTGRWALKQPTDDAIRDRAYLIWEREGRPPGRDRDHWLQAAWELAGEAAKAAARSKAEARTAAAGKRRGTKAPKRK